MLPCNVESSQELFETEAFKRALGEGQGKGPAGNWEQMAIHWAVTEDSKSKCVLFLPFLGCGLNSYRTKIPDATNTKNVPYDYKKRGRVFFAGEKRNI